MNTFRPIEEVDLAVSEDDQPAQVGIYAWKNGVDSVPRPIEAGKMYDVAAPLYPNARLRDAMPKQVVFKGGFTWKPGR